MSIHATAISFATHSSASAEPSNWSVVGAASSAISRTASIDSPSTDCPSIATRREPGSTAAALSPAPPPPPTYSAASTTVPPRTPSGRACRSHPAYVTEIVPTRSWPSPAAAAGFFNGCWLFVQVSKRPRPPNNFPRACTATARKAGVADLSSSCSDVGNGLTAVRFHWVPPLRVCTGVLGSRPGTNPRSASIRAASQVSQQDTEAQPTQEQHCVGPLLLRQRQLP